MSELFLSLIAQLPDGAIMNAMFVYGPMGVMLAWFAFRAEAKLDRIVDRIDTLGHKINGMTTALLADVVTRKDSSDQVRKIAQDMLEKMDRQAEHEAAAPYTPKKRRTFPTL